MNHSADARKAHDELLRHMPAGVEHSCVMCEGGSDPKTTSKEHAVADRTFTEEEHEAILRDAVAREVARAQEETETELEELRSKVDVLEAEKASAEQALEEARQEFEDFKTAQEAAEQAQARRDERVAAVKSLSPNLDDDYFTETRVARWSEMSEEAFEELLDDLAGAAVSRLTPEQAKQLEGLEGDARRAKLAELQTQAREAAGEERETAAFAGGITPGEGGTPSGKSTMSRFLASRGRLPANVR